MEFDLSKNSSLQFPVSTSRLVPVTQASLGPNYRPEYFSNLKLPCDCVENLARNWEKIKLFKVIRSKFSSVQLCSNLSFSDYFFLIRCLFIPELNSIITAQLSIFNPKGQKLLAGRGGEGLTRGLHVIIAGLELLQIDLWQVWGERE